MNAPVACLTDADHQDLARRIETGSFFWLDIEDPGPARMHRLGEQLGLHPLTVDDALNFGQRPKFEDYPGYASMIVTGVDPEAEPDTPILRELHLIVSGDWVLTLHAAPLPGLDALRARYADQPIRSEQFLVYKILEAVTSTFFPMLERIDDAIDEIEDRIVEEPRQACLERIYALKRDLVAMRRVVTPLRDVFARNVERIADLPGLEGDDRLYFRDLYDEMIRVSDLVESYRDLLSNATDLYLSTVANRQGEINKQLTVIATIFLPLTFLTGFFGQNFGLLINHVINHNWTFWVLGLGLEALAVVGFVVFFRTRRWM